MTESENYRNEIRDEAAFVALEEARLVGDVCHFRDRETSHWIKVWCIPGSLERRLVNNGKLEEEQTFRDFDIMRQYGCSCGTFDCEIVGTHHAHSEVLLFPPAMHKFPGSNDPSINSEVKYDGFLWSTESWDADSVQAKFKLHTRRHQPRGTSQE